MLHELRKWLNTSIILIFLGMLGLNGITFRQHMLARDSDLLADYASYQALLDGSDAEILTGGMGEYQYSRQQEHIDRYKAYIMEMPDRARDAYALSADELDLFAERNIAKTVRDFDGLETLELDLGYDYQVIRSFDFKLTDLYFLSLLLLLAVLLFTGEYEEALFPLLTATVSRLGVARAKIVLLICVSFLSALCLYGTNIIIAGAIYGWDDWGRLVQSIEAFRSSSLPLTVGGYFAFSYLLKCLNGIAFALLVYALLSVWKKAIPVILVSGIVLTLSYRLYLRIPINSVHNALHFVNPIHGIDAFRLISRYQNINVFSLPVSILFIWPMFCVLLILISSAVIVRQFISAAILQRNHTWLRFDWYQNNRWLRIRSYASRGGVYTKELWKALITGKAWIVFLLLIAVLWYRVDHYSPYADSDRLAYTYYLRIYGGQVSVQTIEAIEIEQERLLTSDTDALVQIEFDALLRIKNQVETVLHNEASRGIPAYLMNEYELASWLDNPGADQRDILLAFLVAIFAGAGVFARENEIDAVRLLRITPEYRRIRRSKILITVAMSFLASTLVYTARYIEFRRFYRLEYMHAPIQSYINMSDFTYHWTVKNYLLVMVLLRLVAGIILGFVIAAISAKAKNTSLAVSVSTVATVLPVLAQTVGARELRYVTPAWIADANSVLAGPPLVWVWAALLMLILSLVSVYSIKRVWEPQYWKQT